MFDLLMIVVFFCFFVNLFFLRQSYGHLDLKYKYVALKIK